MGSVPLDPTSVTRLHTRHHQSSRSTQQNIAKSVDAAMNSDLITSSDLSGGAELSWVDDVFRKQIDHNLSAMILPGKHDTLHCYIIRTFRSFYLHFTFYYAPTT